MEHVVKGIIQQIFPEQEGTKGNRDWTRLDFLMLTRQGKANPLMLTCWNEVADEVKRLRVGDKVIVTYTVESYTSGADKWWTKATAVEVDKIPDFTDEDQKAIVDEIHTYSNYVKFHQDQGALPESKMVINFTLSVMKNIIKYTPFVKSLKFSIHAQIDEIEKRLESEKRATS